MNSFILKILGIITMLIDHIGSMYFPQLLILRVIGRLSYPIFAFLISEGYRKTSDITDYMGRILVFAFFTQPVYKLAMGSGAHLNVLFTFVLALYAIYVYEKRGKLYLVFIAALAAQVFRTDYGAYGVLMVFIFYVFHKNFKDVFKYTLLITLAYLFMNIIPVYSNIDSFNRLISYCLQLFALPSLVLIYFYNGKLGARAKYLFYIFYPGHLLLLYYLREFIIKHKIDRLLSKI